MKRRYLLIGLFFIVLVCLLFFILRAGPEKKAKDSPATKQMQPKQQSPFKVKQEGNHSNKTQLSREEAGRQWLLSQNRPIDFYGQILDQGGRPVQGVAISYEIAYQDGILRWEGFAYEKGEIKSDENGRFHLHRYKGLGLEIRMEKEEYEFINNGEWGYNFSDRDPNQPAPVISTTSSPYIFKAYKRSEAEFLVQGEYSVVVEPNGQRYGVDLINHKVFKENPEEGNFMVSIERPEGADYRTQYKWSVTIEVPGGGIISSEDVFMNEAPQNGYQEVWSMQIDPDPTGHDNRDLKKKFFLKIRGGKMYGRIEMDIQSLYNDKSAVFMTYFINPLESRNLQFDFEKSINFELINRIGLEKAIEEAKEK